MGERPILFSGPMVLAILAGKKTQTRRQVKRFAITGPNEYGIFDWHDDRRGGKWAGAHKGNGNHPGRRVGIVKEERDNALSLCPYGQPGDRLWVRETFYCDDYRYPDAPAAELKELLEYRADHDCRNWEAGCPCRDESGRSSWRPSIHMPRWASRIDLEVTSVRVERLQSISEEDALAEGIEPFSGRSNRDAYSALWNDINGNWAANPWVWVVSFRRLEKEAT